MREGIERDSTELDVDESPEDTAKEEKITLNRRNALKTSATTGLALVGGLSAVGSASGSQNFQQGSRLNDAISYIPDNSRTETLIDYNFEINSNGDCNPDYDNLVVCGYDLLDVNFDPEEYEKKYTVSVSYMAVSQVTVESDGCAPSFKDRTRFNTFGMTFVETDNEISVPDIGDNTKVTAGHPRLSEDEIDVEETDVEDPDRVKEIHMDAYDTDLSALDYIPTGVSMAGLAIGFFSGPAGIAVSAGAILLGLPTGTNGLSEISSDEFSIEFSGADPREQFTDDNKTAAAININDIETEGNFKLETEYASSDQYKPSDIVLDSTVDVENKPFQKVIDVYVGEENGPGPDQARIEYKAQIPDGLEVSLRYGKTSNDKFVEETEDFSGTHEVSMSDLDLATGYEYTLAMKEPTEDPKPPRSILEEKGTFTTDWLKPSVSESDDSMTLKTDIGGLGSESDQVSHELTFYLKKEGYDGWDYKEQISNPDSFEQHTFSGLSSGQDYKYKIDLMQYDSGYGDDFTKLLESKTGVEATDEDNDTGGGGPGFTLPVVGSAIGGAALYRRLRGNDSEE
jgi:hypothetical protein